MTKKPFFFISIGMMIGTIVLVACGGGSPGMTQTQATPLVTPPAEYAGKTNPLANDPAAAQAGKQIYESDCSTCHGTDARGDGPAAASLDPKPIDLADRQTNLSDAYFFWRISEGSAMLSIDSQMPAWKGILSDEQIWQVITYLRTFGH